MPQLFTNNAATLLTNSPGTGGTTLTVTAGTGNEFPAIESAGADYFLATLFKIVDGVEANHEVVKVTVRATATPDSMTVVRAQEGTTAVNFIAGDRIELRITKGTMESVRPTIWVEKTAAYTAVNKQGVLANTSGGAWTLTLPASPNVGDSVPIIDAAGSFATYALTIARNGSKIMGLAEDMTCSTNNLSFELVYQGATYGWRIF